MYYTNKRSLVFCLYTVRLVVDNFWCSFRSENYTLFLFFFFFEKAKLKFCVLSYTLH